MTNQALRLWVDFNNHDGRGVVRLNCRGTIEELKAKDITLSEGMKIIIYSFELEADAIVRWSDRADGWIAQFDWDRLRRLPGDSLP